LPINESTTDQKRKIKKKNVYALGGNTNATTTNGQGNLPLVKGGAAASTPSQPILRQQIQMAPNVLTSNIMTKPRSRTEIYHPNHPPLASLANPTTINATTLSAAAAAAAAAVASSTTASNTITNISSPASPNRVAQTSTESHNHHERVSAGMSIIGSVPPGSAQQTMLNRQREFLFFISFVS